MKKLSLILVAFCMSVYAMAADAITCDSAVVIGSALSSGASTSETYTVEGYVTSIAYAYSESAGNMSVWMADTKTGGKVFEAFKCTIAKAAIVGDKVQVTGKIQKYVKSSNTTIEISNGSIVIVEEAERLDTVYATCAEAAEYGATLDSTETSNIPYCITGYVVDTVGTVSKGQQCIWMADEKGGEHVFYGYWCNITNGDTIAPSDKITLTGYIQRYNGAVEMKNGNMVLLEKGEGGGEEYTYDYEPTEVTTITTVMTDADYSDYTSDYGMIDLYMENDTCFVELSFMTSSITAETILPVGTFNITDTYAENTFVASVGGTDSYDMPSYFACQYDEEGYYGAAYYLMSGTVTVAAAGEGQVSITINATSYNGSTINITYTGALVEYTAVENVEAAKLDENAPIYNVLGMQVDKNFKGVLIQNGKKFIVR